jgi:hypothetical protein
MYIVMNDLDIHQYNIVKADGWGYMPLLRERAFKCGKKLQERKHALECGIPVEQVLYI